MPSERPTTDAPPVPPASDRPAMGTPSSAAALPLRSDRLLATTAAGDPARTAPSEHPVAEAPAGTVVRHARAEPPSVVHPDPVDATALASEKVAPPAAAERPAIPVAAVDIRDPAPAPAASRRNPVPAAARQERRPHAAKPRREHRLFASLSREPASQQTRRWARAPRWQRAPIATGAIRARRGPDVTVIHGTRPYASLAAGPVLIRIHRGRNGQIRTSRIPLY
jgi:hypothetical protein